MLIKLSIKKLKVFSHSFTRYYTVENILIDTNRDFKTEAQFCYYIYLKHGTGRYLVLAFKKGKSGFWKYWNGDILDNGFVREKDKNKELDNLQKELHKATDYEEREIIEEEIDFEREFNREIKKQRRPCCYGLIKSSPVGTLQSYQELDF